MILAVDVGNSNIIYGVYEGDRLVCTFRMTTTTERTRDEIGIYIINLLGNSNISHNDIKACIISSVVPNVMYELNRAIEKYINVKPMIVGAGLKTGMKINIEAPKELGADRVVDCVAAHEKYGGNLIVIDFGTATTYDLLTEDFAFVTGITAPGIGISARALWEDAARLPRVEIKKPDSIMVHETISSMQAGLVYGQIGQTEYIIRQLKRESGLDAVKVVATGEFGRIIAPETEEIDIYDDSLTLDGLMLLYKKNCKGK